MGEKSQRKSRGSRERTLTASGAGCAGGGGAGAAPGVDITSLEQLVRNQEQAEERWGRKEEGADGEEQQGEKTGRERAPRKLNRETSKRKESRSIRENIDKSSAEIGNK